jgi:hypothetical protein
MALGTWTVVMLFDDMGSPALAGFDAFAGLVRMPPVGLRLRNLFECD